MVTTNSGYWRLNGRDLTDTSVRVIASSASLSQRVRQDYADIYGGTQVTQRLGKDLPQRTIEFVIQGVGTTKYETLSWITDILEDEDVLTIQAPAETKMYLYKTVIRSPVRTNSIDVDDRGAHGTITLRVNVTILGIWIADGGNYCYDFAGSFTLTSGTYLRDDGTNTGSVPTINLPEQTAGYPLGIRASDFAEVQLTMVSYTTIESPDGRPLIIQTYSLDGFLIPEPVDDGDVGAYQVCSSPTEAYLSGGDSLAATYNTDGITLGAVAELTVGE